MDILYPTQFFAFARIVYRTKIFLTALPFKRSVDLILYYLSVFIMDWKYYCDDRIICFTLVIVKCAANLEPANSTFYVERLQEHLTYSIIDYNYWIGQINYGLGYVFRPGSRRNSDRLAHACCARARLYPYITSVLYKTTVKVAAGWRYYDCIESTRQPRSMPYRNIIPP